MVNLRSTQLKASFITAMKDPDLFHVTLFVLEQFKLTFMDPTWFVTIIIWSKLSGQHHSKDPSPLAIEIYSSTNLSVRAIVIAVPATYFSLAAKEV